MAAGARRGRPGHAARPGGDPAGGEPAADRERYPLPRRPHRTPRPARTPGRRSGRVSLAPRAGAGAPQDRVRGTARAARDARAGRVLPLQPRPLDRRGGPPPQNTRGRRCGRWRRRCRSPGGPPGWSGRTWTASCTKKEDVVVVVGQDGLVANTAKYPRGQPVVGIDTDPGRNPGVLVRHRSADAAALLGAATAGGGRAEELTMVEAVADDTQRLVALNEIYLGPPGHQTARYRLGPDGEEGPGEAQASSGLLVGTGTGATGWLRSLWLERGSTAELPAPCDRRLLWFVREAWPSPATGTGRVAGELGRGQGLRLTVESDRIVVFGDGMEADALELTWGQSVRLGIAETSLRLVT
ncbi:conserved hypothetical protein [Streptomyces sp. C]|nr:conserved hypothetical protein [Streptomyces sp. C]